MLHRNDNPMLCHRKLYMEQTILPLHYSNLSPQIVAVTTAAGVVVVLAVAVDGGLIVAAAVVVAIAVADAADGFDEIVDALKKRK